MWPAYAHHHHLCSSDRCVRRLSVTCVHLCYLPWPVFICVLRPVFICPIDSIESCVPGVRPCIQTSLCNGKVKSLWQMVTCLIDVSAKLSLNSSTSCRWIQCRGSACWESECSITCLVTLGLKSVFPDTGLVKWMHWIMSSVGLSPCHWGSWQSVLSWRRIHSIIARLM